MAWEWLRPVEGQTLEACLVKGKATTDWCFREKWARRGREDVDTIVGRYMGIAPGWIWSYKHALLEHWPDRLRNPCSCEHSGSFNLG